MATVMTKQIEDGQEIRRDRISVTLKENDIDLILTLCWQAEQAEETRPNAFYDLATKLHLYKRELREKPCATPSDVKAGDVVRLRWNGYAPVAQMDTGRWATVRETLRTRITIVMGDGHMMNISPDHIDKIVRPAKEE